MTTQQRIDNIMDCFNFEKVNKVMKHLKWTWGSQGVPEVYSLRVQARSLLLDAIKLATEDTTSHPETRFFVGTGGFQATAYRNSKGEVDYLGLDFTVSSWESYDEPEN